MVASTPGRRVWLWAPPLVYMAVIFYFSAQSDPMPVVTEHVWDKLLHTAEYLGLATLLFRALYGEGLGRWQAAILTVILASGYGASDEWHQAFVPMRSSDVQDWFADTFAAGMGAAASVLFVVSRPSRPRHRPRR